MPSAGDRFGDFTLTRELGRGAMGVVWEAWQESLSRAVALKILKEGVAEDPVWVARFKAEANAAARLSHPGILPVYAVGETGGLHWFAMEKVEGEDLAARLKARGPFPWAESARFARDAARALEHAHAAGVVHRDIKPANLMLRTDGRIALTDFGLSKETTAGGLTTTGMLVGTPYYMSPELIAGDPSKVTPRSDLYSLGVTLYELLTAEPPFRAESAMALIQLIAHADPVPPSARNPRVPADLETIALVAMAKDPARRYASAGELADDLDRFLAHEPISRRRPGWPERLLRLARRNRVAVAVGVAALLVLLAVTILFRRELKDRDQDYREEIARLLAEADALAESGDEERADAIEAQLEQRAGADAEYGRAHAIETARDLVEDLRAGKPLSQANQRKIAAWAGQAQAQVTLKSDAAGVTVTGRRLSGVEDRSEQAVALDGSGLTAGLWRLLLSAPGRLPTLVTLLAPPGLSGTLRVTLPEEGGRNAGLVSYGGAFFPAEALDTAAGAEAVFERLQPPYLLARARVTARAYLAFVEAAPAADRGRLTPAAWTGGRPREALLDEPIVGLTFEQAQAFAASQGLRLPTDAELMHAAAGARAQAFTRGLRAQAGGGTVEARRRLVEEARQSGLQLERTEGLGGWDGRPEWAVSAKADEKGQQRPWPLWPGWLQAAAVGPAGRAGRAAALRRTPADVEAVLEGKVALRLARSLEGS